MDALNDLNSSDMRIAILEKKIHRQQSLLYILLSSFILIVFLGLSNKNIQGTNDNVQENNPRHGIFSGTFVGRIVSDQICIVGKDSIIRAYFGIDAESGMKDSSFLHIGSPESNQKYSYDDRFTQGITPYRRGITLTYAHNQPIIRVTNNKRKQLVELGGVSNGNGFIQLNDKKGISRIYIGQDSIGESSLLQMYDS